MTIATLSDYASCVKQTVRIAGRQWGSIGAPYSGYLSGFETAADPPVAGSWDFGNTTSGVVPTSTTAGAPSIRALTGVANITRLELTVANSSQSIQVVSLYDMLFGCGKFPNVGGSQPYTLSSQPGFSARVPGGTDYSGIQIFVVAIASTSGIPSTVTVTYTNEAGAAGHTTGAVTPGWAGVGANSLFRLPLAAGDKGVSKIESVDYPNGSGTNSFSVLLLKPLTMIGACVGESGPNVSSASRTIGLETTGLPEVYSDSLILPIGKAASGAGPGDLQIEIAGN